MKRNVWGSIRTHAGLSSSRSHVNTPLDFADSSNKLSARTKSSGFKVYGCKVSSSNSGFVTFQIRDVSANSFFVCVNTHTNLVLKHS